MFHPPLYCDRDKTHKFWLLGLVTSPVYGSLYIVHVLVQILYVWNSNGNSWDIAQEIITYPTSVRETWLAKKQPKKSVYFLELCYLARGRCSVVSFPDSTCIQLFHMWFGKSQTVGPRWKAYRLRQQFITLSLTPRATVWLFPNHRWNKCSVFYYLINHCQSTQEKHSKQMTGQLFANAGHF